MRAKHAGLIETQRVRPFWSQVGFTLIPSFDSAEKWEGFYLCNNYWFANKKSDPEILRTIFTAIVKTAETYTILSIRTCKIVFRNPISEMHGMNQENIAIDLFQCKLTWEHIPERNQTVLIRSTNVCEETDTNSMNSNNCQLHSLVGIVDFRSLTQTFVFEISSWDACSIINKHLTLKETEKIIHHNTCPKNWSFSGALHISHNQTVFIQNLEH